MRSLSMHHVIIIIINAQMEFHILSFFSVVAFHLAYIYGVQNEFYYFWTGTQHVALKEWEREREVGGGKDIQTETEEECEMR